MAPLFLSLKNTYKLNVKFKNLYLAYFYIYLYRPKLILLSNAHGDESTFKLVKHLSSLGINVITLTTEGNFTKKYLFGYLWGWNNDLVLYQNYLLLWNEKSRQLILDEYPYLKDQLLVSGSVGHDRYKILKFRSKEDFLKTIGRQKEFKKVVGLASFGLFAYINDADYFRVVNPNFSMEALEIYKQDISKLRNIYYNIIKENPDILFLLRPHPEQVIRGNVENSELSNLDCLPNIYWSSRYTDIPGIDDAISVSDMWIAYESNTSLEAWLLNKPTVYINPTTTEFERENHYLGNAIASCQDQLQGYIDEFYRFGKIEDFESRRDVRENMMKEIFEYTDGKNYRRTADMINDLIVKMKNPDYSKSRRELRQNISWKNVLVSVIHRVPLYFKIRKSLNRNIYLAPMKSGSIQHYVGRFSKFIQE
jgi:hypothetical protein